MGGTFPAVADSAAAPGAHQGMWDRW